MWVLVALGWPPLGQRRLSFQSAKPKGMPQTCRLLSDWAVLCGITVEKLIFHLQCAEGCQGHTKPAQPVPGSAHGAGAAGAGLGRDSWPPCWRHWVLGSDSPPLTRSSFHHRNRITTSKMPERREIWGLQGNPTGEQWGNATGPQSCWGGVEFKGKLPLAGKAEEWQHLPVLQQAEFLGNGNGWIKAAL